MKLLSCVRPSALVVLFAMLAPGNLRAQSTPPEDLYVFDSEWKPTVIEKAKYLISVRKMADSVWQWDTYNFKGPLLKTETYSDREGKNRNGVAYYYTEGNLDSIARYRHGMRNGTFYHLATENDTLKWKVKYEYENDSLVSTKSLDDNGEDGEPKTDTANEKESEYPGGLRKWSNYLVKTIRYPERAVKENISGTVRALFSVDETGKVGEIYPGRSVEYSLDREVIRVIRKSGNWVPATKNGIAVKSWKLQPVALRLR